MIQCFSKKKKVSPFKVFIKSLKKLSTYFRQLGIVVFREIRQLLQLIDAEANTVSQHSQCILPAPRGVSVFISPIIFNCVNLKPRRRYRCPLLIELRLPPAQTSVSPRLFHRLSHSYPFVFLAWASLFIQCFFFSFFISNRIIALYGDTIGAFGQLMHCFATQSNIKDASRDGCRERSLWLKVFK